MKGFNITIKQHPTESDLQVLLRSKLKHVTDFKKVHKQASILLDRWVQKNFKTGGSGLGSDSWAPFKVGGRYVKRELDTSAKLLQDTGALRLSHLPFHSGTDAGIGSALPYAKHHQFGTVNLPMRRTLPKESEVRAALLALFEHHAKESLA